MDERLADRLRLGLDRAARSGAAAAKISYGCTESVDCRHEAGRLKSVTSGQRIFYTVEVLRDGRRGVAFGNDLAALDGMVERAMALARVGSAAHFDAYPAPAPTTAVWTYDEQTAAWPLEAMVEASGRLAAGLKAHDPLMYAITSSSRRACDGLLVTSGGVCHSTRSTQWSLWAGAQRTDGTDMLFAEYGRGWNRLSEHFDPEDVLERVLTDLRHGQTIVAPPVGRLPVFVEPRGVGMLLQPVAMGLNGRSVVKGDSPLRDRLGEQVLDPCLTLVDDPHVDFRPGSAETDEDGVPTRVNRLFEAGVLRRFLFDLDTAGMAGCPPTGNSGCRPYGLTLRPGTCPRAGLLEGIADGLYVKILLGYGQTPNFINGDFSANVGLGFRVRDGQIVGRVKNTMVAGNVYALLKSGVELSAEVDPVEGLPWAVVPGVTVSA